MGVFADFILINRFAVKWEERNRTFTPPANHRRPLTSRSTVDPKRTRIGRLSEATTNSGLAKCHRSCRRETRRFSRKSRTHSSPSTVYTVLLSEYLQREDLQRGPRNGRKYTLTKHKAVHVWRLFQHRDVISQARFSFSRLKLRTILWL